MMIDLVKWYEDVNYKALMIIPTLLIIFSVAFLFYQYQTTGEWFQKGIDLKGGTLLSIEAKEAVNDFELEQYLQEKGWKVEVKAFSSVSGQGLSIETSPNIDQDKLLQNVKDFGVNVDSYSFQSVGSKLSESFFEQSRLALILAFLFMGIVVFIVFKEYIPGLAVILAAFTDIVGTLAFMQILGINLTLASFSGLLLILGYSIDTDILLTTRVIKRRKGTVVSRSIRAMKTGFTMGFTTLGALTVLYLVSNAPTLKEIASVLIIALLIDLISTWLMNLGILRWWKGA
ncbi:MAG: protein translocase subunit SecF [Candidatus Aenigmatarchaeota archaeon]